MNPKELRLKTVEMSIEHGDAHFGGCFSEIEILLSVFNRLKEEDRFILSKGHASYPYYVLLREKGFNPKITLHPDKDIANGIYCTTGSLGHSLPIAVGLALAKKIEGEKGIIYVLLGDGECQEGTTWETLPLIKQYQLDNIVVIVDDNKIQAINKTDDVSKMDLYELFKPFGIETFKVDGHSTFKLDSVLNNKGSKIIIAETIKGKGISFMENNPDWHARNLTDEELKQVYKELDEEYFKKYLESPYY